MINSPIQKDSGRKLFFGLFIFPLLIAVGMAVLLCTVVLLTRETETPESLIMAIKTGAPSKRWQKAFELSNELNQGRGMIRAEGVMKEVIHILNEREEYDSQTRSYMAIALSRFKEPEVIPALREALKKEQDPEVELHIIWALGIQSAKEAVKDIHPYLESEREDVRAMAVYVLGVLQDKTSVKLLEPLLDDEARDVRWNAALSLARLGSDAGYAHLVKMLDRESLKNFEGLPDDKIEQIMVNAVKGIGLLGRSDSLSLLNQLAKNDSSLKVRQAAIEAVQYQNQKVT
ncbi:MAG: HEAT repeat domain-containing protein [Candidatus Omnitrophica bacterium]|nr:HEAT repeat domain-containing protein [Candidatus Omnitrophota bacterium]